MTALRSLKGTVPPRKRAWLCGLWAQQRGAGSIRRITVTVSWMSLGPLLLLSTTVDMTFRSVSKEALVGSATLGFVFVAGYFLGKTV